MELILKPQQIEGRIFTLRGVQVMLDRDLAELYGVEVRRLNEQSNRNIERFPESFRFQLTREEFEGLNPENLKSQIATSSWGGARKLPYAFTEQGVAMLSAVLRSETAIQTSIYIMNAFVAMRRHLAVSGDLLHRVDSIEKRQIAHERLSHYSPNW
ncbi:MAG: ORF6N domain-containing protein [Thermoguttaceae bacterium]